RARRRQRGNPLRRAGAGLGRGARRYAPLLLAVAIVALVVGLGMRGIGPLGKGDAVRRLGGREPVSSETAATGSTTTTTRDPSTSSTSTSLDVRGMSYDAGSCITWSQDASRTDPDRVTKEVDCTEPHLFEVTTHYEIDGTPYGEDGPTDAEWNQIGDTE